MATSIGVSAEFGGRDAAQAVLPHFKALKRAAETVALKGFPARDLTLILRVDGEIRSYAATGPGAVDVAEDGEYVSIDIVLSVDDRDALDGGLDTNPVVVGVLASAPLLAEQLALSPRTMAMLRRSLQQVCRAYLEGLG